MLNEKQALITNLGNLSLHTFGDSIILQNLFRKNKIDFHS